MIEHVTTSGVFSLDGSDFEVENNVWIVGDGTEVLVIDAALLELRHRGDARVDDRVRN